MFGPVHFGYIIMSPVIPPLAHKHAGKAEKHNLTARQTTEGGYMGMKMASIV